MDIGATSWLLQSILHCEQEHAGAALRDVIAFGDFVNHAIFSFTEFSMAIGFLAAAGVVIETENSLKTSQGFQIWYRQNIFTSTRPNYERERKLFAEYLTRVLPGKTPLQTRVSELEFRLAVDAYLADSQ